MVVVRASLLNDNIGHIDEALLEGAKRKDNKRRNTTPYNTSTLLPFLSVVFLVCIFHLVWISFQDNHHRDQQVVHNGHSHNLSDIEPYQYKKESLSVSEAKTHFPSFWKFANKGAIAVSYDSRAILLNGTRSLFLSGSIHPVRATLTGWKQALDDAVLQGLNLITLYIFWSAHQPFPNTEIDWNIPDNSHDSTRSNWDIASAIREAANRGLFVHVRIGPYCDAEYSYGGIPDWLPLKYPHMQMRRLDPEWQTAMASFVKSTTSYLRYHRLWAYQGGPVILAQIENELGDDYERGGGGNIDQLRKVDTHPTLSNIQAYADWCGSIATEYEPEVVWTMCMGATASNAINTCNGFGNHSCSTSFLEHNGQTGRILVDQPALWTENEGGFQTWGEDPEHPTDYFWGRSARETARDTLKWFARGGSHNNYYMWWGGYNRGRIAGANIANMYASNAMLCSSGERHEPMYSHLKDMHLTIAQIAPSILALSPAVAQSVEVEEASGQWKNGHAQRVFVYNDVIFVENDADAEVLARFSVNGNDFRLRLNPLSVLVLNDGRALFDSSHIDPVYKQWHRTTTAVEDFNHDWVSPISVLLRKDDPNIFSTELPIEQTELAVKSKLSSDFAVYQTDVLFRNTTSSSFSIMKIETQTANAFSLFVDGHFVGSALNHEHKEQNSTLSIPLTGSLSSMERNITISLLSESLGYYNELGRWGSGTNRKTKGITGKVWIENPNGSVVQVITNDGSSWLSSTGLPEGSSKVVDNSSAFFPPCSWSQFSFRTPPLRLETPLFLRITSGRGKLWLNERDLGRFWNTTRASTDTYTQQYYHLPADFLHRPTPIEKNTNIIRLYHATAFDASQIWLVQSHVEASSRVEEFPDEVEFSRACLQ